MGRGRARMIAVGDLAREWLEADGLGGFASGTVAGPRTRRYHALLLTSEDDGTRFALVNGAEVSVQTAAGTWPLSSQIYAGTAIAPPAASHQRRFTAEPWPCWRFLLSDGSEVSLEILASQGQPRVLLRWCLERPVGGRTLLRVRPLLSGRDYHALHQHNARFAFDPEVQGDRLVFRPYPGVPGVALASNGRYRHQPLWYRNFHYLEEEARGLDHKEDLAAPGELTFDLSAAPAVLILSRHAEGAAPPPQGQRPAALLAEELRQAERQRRSLFPRPLHRAADAYLVARGPGKTIIAGYPWFTDWGRDTFIALRGLCLATGRLDDAGAILLRWAGAVSAGMLPNRFPDGGAAPDYNSVDAALWYAVVVNEYLQAAAPSADKRRPLVEAVEAILCGYAAGTRFGIAAAADGLLAAGEPGLQLTWMDAKIGDWVVSPRTGKPVEVQALWLNALAAAVDLGTPSARRWQQLLARGRAAFVERFWDPRRRRLYDVVDVDHQAGTTDATCRPNQILAVGGLPLTLLDNEQARAVVDAVEAQLYTPLGLRSLAPGEPGYRPRYTGGARERDSAYHQGTAWAWLLGPFVEAWVRVRGGGLAARREARLRFLPPLQAHLDDAGLGHVSEVADAEAPHHPGGCPFQAWSLGELLRLTEVVLADDTARPG
jgi:predicted glycogen debranching enzyme